MLEKHARARGLAAAFASGAVRDPFIGRSNAVTSRALRPVEGQNDGASREQQPRQKAAEHEKHDGRVVQEPATQACNACLKVLR